MRRQGQHPLNPWGSRPRAGREQHQKSGRALTAKGWERAPWIEHGLPTNSQPPARFRLPTKACVTTAAARRSRLPWGSGGEGLANKEIKALQAAWTALDVPQCGYCQSGQLMTASSLLAEIPHPTDADIDSAMAGNICPCATYVRIRAAIHLAAGTMRGVKPCIS